MSNLRLLAISVVVWVTACAEGDAGPCPPTHPLLRPQPLQVRLAGTEASVPVRAECKKVGAQSTSVNVTVRDSAGAALPFTMDPPTKEGETHSVTVNFVPGVGNTTVSAEFEPALGDVEIVVVGMRDRTHELPVIELQMPGPCSSYHRAGSLVACGHSSLEIFLDGGLLAELPQASALEATETLWSWTEGGVTRWNGADRLELVAPLGPYALAVSAHDDRLVLDVDGDLWQFAAVDGGLERSPVLIDGGVRGLAHPPLEVDGGWVWIEKALGQACFRGPRSALSCAPFEYPVQAAEPGGFWVNDGRLGFARFGAGPRPISFVSLNQPLEVISYPPRLQYQDLVVSVRSDTLELEAWPPFPIAKVTPRHVFGISGSRVSIFVR